MTNEIKALELTDAPSPDVKTEASAKPAEEKKDGAKAKKGAKVETLEETQAKIIEGRTTALRTALDKIEDSFGKGAIMRWGDKIVDSTIEVVPTGCLGLDIALGVGGIPRGRIIEIYGPESSGKTTVTLHMVAEVQKMRGIAAFIDAEHALDPVYAKNLGVNIDDLYISQPDNGEQALDIAEDMVRSGAIDLIVIDSVAALTPKTEIEGVMGQAQMGLQARLMSQALRKLTGICSRTRTMIIFTNQLRANLNPYGAPETTTGGRALKFYASIRLHIKRDGDPIKSGDKLVGNHTIVKVAKNKVAPPFKIATFDIMYGKGISYEGDLLDIGAAEGVINKSGSWYSYGEHSMGQGREPAKTFLKNNPDICEAVENAVREKNGMKTLTDIRNTPLKEPVTLEIKARKEKKSTKKDKKAQPQSSNDDDFGSSEGFDGGEE